MKKIFTAIVLFALVVLPMSVMAMTTIADNELSTVTGQAGVSINVDVTANLSIGTVAWGDRDGFSQPLGTAATDVYDNPGFVGISSLNLTVHASGRHDSLFATTTATNIGYMENDPIKIDVGSNSDGVALVRIGLPTFHITVSALDTSIFVSGGTEVGTGLVLTPGTPQSLGDIYMSGIEIRLGQLPSGGTTAADYDAGFVTIGAANTAANSGVNIGFNVKIDSVAIGTISYGNTTSLLSAPVASGGFGAAATEGYIGVTGLNLDDVNIYGGVAIGVGTLDTDALSNGSGQGVITQVNIIIANNTTIAIPNAITGNVMLASNKQLTAGAGELGSFYIGGVRLRFTDNGGSSLSQHSLIQIWAH